MYGEALSKYQFETAAAIGMRHAFHRPLRPAFHFYLYLPGCLSSPIPSSRRRSSYPDVPGSPGTWWKKAVAARRRCELLCTPPPPLSRYFMTFCFQSAGRRRRGIKEHLGPYSTFMALNRDEVSHEWTNVLSSSSWLPFHPPWCPLSSSPRPIVTAPVGESASKKVESSPFLLVHRVIIDIRLSSFLGGEEFC